MGINLSQGFGPQPGNLIRNRVANASCLTTCANGGGGGNDDPTPPTCEQQQLLLRLQLDTYSPETTWSLRNAAGTVVAQGGPYPKTLANQLVADTLCLSEGCYTFQITDAYNDGICCTYGNGSYLLLDGEQQLIAEGGEFPNAEEVTFCLPFTGGGDGEDCETINFNDYTINSYGLNQDGGQHAVLDEGQTLYLENNAWKSVDFPYEITANTVIAFDFKSTRQGEIHGIGFDNNESISYGYTFKVHGTQAWGLSNFDHYAGTGDWQSYEIPVGQFYTGMADRLFFATDHDSGTRNGNSWFRNVRIYEGEECETQNLIQNTTAVSASSSTSTVQIAPNPILAGSFSLSVDRVGNGPASWQILSLTGQVLREEYLQLDGGGYQQQIPVSGLARGTYLLRWRDGKGEQTKRFAVQ